MVASNDSSAPLVAIIGITGNQGSSVANALIASAKPYRLVGLTRDTEKPASKEWQSKGVDMKAATIAVGNEGQVREAFKGADIVFVSLLLHIVYGPGHTLLPDFLIFDLNRIPVDNRLLGSF